MATERDIRLGLRVEGLDKTRQDFNAVGESVKALGPEGAAAADAIVSGFKQIEQASDKTAGKIADGRKVSQAELDKLILGYDDLRNTIETSFPEGAPAELTAAMQKAEDRISATIKAADQLPAKMNAARDAFRDVVPAVEALEETVRTPLTNAFARAEAAVDDFTRKLETEGDVGKGEIEKITKTQHLLDLEIQKTVGSYDKLDAESKKAYDRIQKEAGEATKVVVDLEKANKKVEDSIDGQIRGFTGFGDALQQMGGKAGAAAVQLGLITAALQQGLAAGQQFNQFAKTDMSEWDDQMSLLALRANDLGEAYGELWLEQGKLIRAFVTGDLKLLKEAWDELGDTTGKLGSVISTTNDELRKQRDANNEAKESTKEKTDADKAAAEASRKSSEEVAAMVRAQNEHIAAMEEAAIAAEVLNMEIERESVAVDAATLAHVNASLALADAEAQHRNFAGLTTQVSDALEIAREKAAALAIEYGADSAAAKNAARDVDGLEYSLTLSKQSTDRVAAAAQSHREKQDDAAKAVEEHTTRLNDLQSGQEKISISADAAAEATKRLANASSGAVGGLIAWSKGVDLSRTAVSSLSKDVESGVGAYSKLTDAVNSSTTALDGLLGKAERVAVALREIEKASAAAAGTPATAEAAPGGTKK